MTILDLKISAAVARPRAVIERVVLNRAVEEILGEKSSVNTVLPGRIRRMIFTRDLDAKTVRRKLRDLAAARLLKVEVVK